METNLGRLQKVHLREVWPLEPSDFTPWLAKNISLLGDELGLEIDPESLSNIQTEVSVGAFSADIVAKDAAGETILIENQYGRTDHDHLGKVLTYAAGLGAKTIIWVTEFSREEHQKAVEFLNNHTTDELNFFLVQIEAWRIGDSLPAPKFSVIERPNEWGKLIKSASAASTPDGGELNLFKRNFWEKVRDYAVEFDDSIPWRSPSRENWQSLPTVQRKYAQVVMLVTTAGHGRIGDGATISVQYEFWPLDSAKKHSDDKSLFDALVIHRNEIEHELGMQLKWNRGDGQKYSKICAIREGNYRNPAEQDDIAKWLVETAVKFYRIFPQFDRGIRTTS